MKKHALLAIALFTFLACSKDETVAIQEPEIMDSELGSDFRKVDFSYTDVQDGIQYVNNTPGVQSLNSASNGINGQHWVYKSPSTSNQEIGFSVLYAEACESGPCDVILFLHGSNGTENSGATLFFDYYLENKSDQPRAFIFANGISEIDSGNGHPWQLREENGKTLNSPKQLVELIGAIVEDSTLFPFMKKDMNHWSVTGFSAGASGVMGTYMDPIFQNNAKYQPKHIFPLGGWMTDSLYKYFDFDGGLAQVTSCDSSELELIIANHLEDDVDCTGAKQYQSKEFLVDHFTTKEVPFTYLGLTDEGLPCEMGDGNNPVHSVKFYLRNSIPNSIQNVSCIEATYLEMYQVLGDMLYRDY